MIDRRPRLIARCADVADVMTAVNFGREQKLLVAIRGGGHLDEAHHRLARSHHGFQVSREGEVPGDRLLLHGLIALRHAARY
jgi:hypothetical protein